MLASKITQRWIKNSFAVIVAIILIAEILGVIAVKRYFYNSVSTTLENEAELVVSAFQQYAQSSVGNFDEKVRDYVATFPMREQIELIIVDENGRTTVTSSGFFPSETAMPDYIKASEENLRIATTTGTLDGEEKAMITILMSPVQSQSEIMAIRLATAMKRVDQRIFAISVLMILVGILILLLVLYSSNYFIKSIVAPIGKVGETAKKIAQGDFDTRVAIRYDDEIGELSQLINYMAGELSTTERMKNDFISSVSHELRTPLTAIQGWAETIKLDGGENKELLDKGMNIIIGETVRLSGMVEELLDFSHMQSGRLKLMKTQVNPIDELTKVVLMYTQRAQREKIKLIYENELEDVQINGDKNRLGQVFINIIDNAVKYSDPEDTVTISTAIKDNYLVIKVADTGIGISDADLPQITHKFYKADSTRRGSGIGLAVAEEIVTRHEGILTVTSKKGEGTTITIALPLYSGGKQSTILIDQNNTKEFHIGEDLDNNYPS